MDEIEITNKNLTELLERKIESIRTIANIPETMPTGFCLWCESPIRDKSRRWCDAECRDIWEKQKNRRTM